MKIAAWAAARTDRGAECLAARPDGARLASSLLNSSPPCIGTSSSRWRTPRMTARSSSTSSRWPGSAGARLLLLHVADGWAARNYNTLTLQESEEMQEDRNYLAGLEAELVGGGLRGALRAGRRGAGAGDRAGRGGGGGGFNCDEHAWAPAAERYPAGEHGGQGAPRGDGAGADAEEVREIEASAKTIAAPAC